MTTRNRIRMVIERESFDFFRWDSKLYVRNGQNSATTGEFDDVLDSSSSKHLSDPLAKIHLMYCNVKSLTSSVQSNGSMLLENRQELLDIENLTLQTPSSNATLIRDLSLKINEKDHLLVGNLFVSLTC
ncbi:hypothetical protein RHMOL_Rhmol09G0055300 [Rhododendron molle]|uniref:Uncharacterized protein n=1 Tax=Rhododendron molle TaxID=49168 RepID=A0ACC0MAC3_RHOML|nr:hypothetical protein RHMOL_Rhmol09G0055300 [Rhododendron molle]